MELREDCGAANLSHMHNTPSTFPPATETEWLTKVAKATKGAAFAAEQVLFQRQKGPAAARALNAPWGVFARVDAHDAVKARLQAEDDIANGVTGLIIPSPAQVPALEHLPLHRLSLRNEGSDLGAEALRHLIARQPLDPARMDVDFSVQDADLAKLLVKQGFAKPLMRGDGRSFHSGGADDAEELGAALASAIAALRKLSFLDGAALASAVSLTLSATQDMFSTLAKFRTARILWRKVLNACGLPDTPIALHAETSRVMLAETDAHTNILRSVTAVFGAGLGGADTISVLPFSFNQGVPNAFARRVARNVQNLLLHESQLWRVADPAAGAGAIESRTQAMCEKAWAVMQRCETGEWPQLAPEKAKARPLIGVTAYQPKQDAAPEVEAV